MLKHISSISEGLTRSQCLEGCLVSEQHKHIQCLDPFNPPRALLVTCCADPRILRCLEQAFGHEAAVVSLAFH